MDDLSDLNMLPDECFLVAGGKAVKMQDQKWEIDENGKVQMKGAGSPQVQVIVAEAMVCSPGDQILLTIDTDMDEDTANMLMTQMRERFPDNEVTLIAGKVKIIKVTK